MTGDELRQRRQALNLTQKALADKLGVTRMAVYYWERGTNPIPKVVEMALRVVECEGR